MRRSRCKVSSIKCCRRRQLEHGSMDIKKYPDRRPAAPADSSLPLLSFDPGGIRKAAPRRACPDGCKDTRCKRGCQLAFNIYFQNELLRVRVCIPTQPIVSKIVHKFAEFFISHRLDKITVDMMTIGACHILFRFRRGQDDDGHVLEFVPFLD
jgi:hypothetical protein